MPKRETPKQNNSIAVAPAELSYQDNPSEFLFALKFETNRKANFKRVAGLCQKAAVFEAINLNDKKSAYFVAFAKSQASLAYLVIEEMRQASWKYTLFANGRIVKNKFSIINMLDCFCTAKALKDHKAHCHVVKENVTEDGTSFTIKITDGEEDGPTDTWLLPCAMVADTFFLNAKDPIKPESRFEAEALRAGVNLCPLFDASHLKRLTDSDKKYWD